MENRTFVPGVLVVSFNEGINPNEAEKIINGLGLTISRTFRGRMRTGLNAFINVPVGKELEWKDKLSKVPEILICDLSPVIKIC